MPIPADMTWPTFAAKCRGTEVQRCRGAEVQQRCRGSDMEVLRCRGGAVAEVEQR